MEKRYVVVGYKPWNRRIFLEKLKDQPGEWTYIDEREALTAAELAKLDPRYVFFLHWSWKVPTDILDNFECVCFHMTDVPYGRGGSPLQNLIARGHRETKLTALRMTDKFDEGPVYTKRPMSLEGGSAEEIFIRATELSADIAVQLAKEEPTPVPQTGEPTNFRRRKPEESLMPSEISLQGLFDHIRMLDADGYPKAFIEHGGYRYTFNRATLYDGRVEANVVITKEGV